MCIADPVMLHFCREVPIKDAKEFAESIAAIFIETSARNAVNVEELFQSISKFRSNLLLYEIFACPNIIIF